MKVNPKLRVKILRAQTINNTDINEGNMMFDQRSGEMYFDLEEQRVVIGRPKWSKITGDGIVEPVEEYDETLHITLASYWDNSINVATDEKGMHAVVSAPTTAPEGYGVDVDKVFEQINKEYSVATKTTGDIDLSGLHGIVVKAPDGTETTYRAGEAHPTVIPSNYTVTQYLIYFGRLDTEVFTDTVNNIEVFCKDPS